jgi:hypothetical protein
LGCVFRQNCRAVARAAAHIENDLVGRQLREKEIDLLMIDEIFVRKIRVHSFAIVPITCPGKVY